MLDPLIAEIESFFPEARSSQQADLDGWQAAYQADPVGTYRRADARTRAAMDRALLADAIQKRIETRAAQQPDQALALADEASQALPDRPEVAERLRKMGLDTKAENVATLRKFEVEALAKTYREELNQPERARVLLRRWLEDQRGRLNRRDAEGRVLLAGQFETMIDDRDTAVELLREAWTIDPGNMETANAFRRLGYHQVGDLWESASRNTAKSEPAAAKDDAPKAARRPGEVQFLGLTRAEVETIIGKPNQIARVATQGELREQWIITRLNSTQYITFARDISRPHAVVISYESLP